MERLNSCILSKFSIFVSEAFVFAGVNRTTIEVVQFFVIQRWSMTRRAGGKEGGREEGKEE